MFSKFELIGAGVCVGLMATAIYLVQLQTIFDTADSVQPAAVAQAGAVVVPETDNDRSAQAAALREAADNQGNLNRMVIDDIKIGAGVEVKGGDTVSVHYVGRLQDGTEFDNSKKRGAPLEFKVGSGMVIQGWEEGLVGMQLGGERILVIPPEKAYGDQGIGPIPGGATLIFSIELLEIK
ncbi:MAG: FKBP-type peptidyl-prolyl cis-trans isomerase [Candidatus Paceibacteria bacterium]|jgi:FKBP-type peptidyl-prolyl cis-trans isomerase